MYKGPLTIILAVLVYAGYSYFSIKGLTSGIGWHLCQWLSAGLFILAGIFHGYWQCIHLLDWHNFGRIVGVSVLAIPVYVFFLHWLL